MRAGIDMGEDLSAVAGPRVAAELDQVQLEADSLTVAGAATALGVDRSRVRQRLSAGERSLLGFHRRGGRHEWLLPRFQFDLGLDRLDDWATVLGALPLEHSPAPAPLMVWLTAPVDHYGGRSRAEQVREGVDERMLAEARSYRVLS